MATVEIVGRCAGSRHTASPTLVDGVNYDLGVGTTAAVTIADQPVPVVTVQAIGPNASEVGPVPGTFRFTRMGDTAFSLAVVFTRHRHGRQF